MNPDRLAHAFHDAAATFDSLSPWLWDPISRDAVDRLAARRGERVLDLCCGTGASALPLAQAVGPGGCVDAVDQAPGLLEFGRRRGAEQDLAQLVFHAADVTQWQRPGERYDAVACVLGVFFLSDRDRTVTRLLADNLRPGGRAVVTVWAETGVQPLGQLLWDAIGRRDPARTAESPAPGVRLETEAALLGFAASVGLRSPRVSYREGSVTIDSDRAWALCMGTGFAGLLTGLDDADIAAVRAELGDGLAAARWQLDVSVRHLVGVVG